MVKVKLFHGHALDALKQIPDNSVDCIITSPPYWSLRKYPDSTNTVWDGNPNCKHKWTEENFCVKCGAWLGQLGLEPDLNLYLKHLLQITAELKRVLKPTGVMFWNHSDSYIGSYQGYGVKDPNYKATGFQDPRFQEQYVSHYQKPPSANYEKLPEKCMALQNFRLLLKLVDEQGFILRNIICWFKRNHLPESVNDRFTKAYEPIFMLVKNKKYYFNLDAVREPLKSFAEQRKSDMKRILQYGKFLNPIALGYNSKFLNNPNALAGSSKNKLILKEVSGKMAKEVPIIFFITREERKVKV